MSSVRVDVQPTVLQWAVARSGIDADALHKAFPKYDDWLAGETKPTWKQLKRFADRTYTPFGFLFLDEPVDEALPVPDLRTLRDEPVAEPSVDLLDVVLQCQSRQDWYRDHMRLNGDDALPFIGRATATDPLDGVAADIASTLGWGTEARSGCRTWTEALTTLRELAENARILVMISGYVGANTHRTLDPEEFRGLALSDPYAPLVFINGRDSKAAQVFTLIHEIAHLWLGVDGVSDLEPEAVRQVPTERWCNEVAAEVLVPMAEFRAAFDDRAELMSQLQSLAERFRVSTQVILGRIREAGLIDWDRYRDLLDAERRRVAEALANRDSGGGNYYNSKPVQVSKRFARALMASTLEGHTQYTEAFRLLDLHKKSTFDELGARLGVV